MWPTPLNRQKKLCQWIVSSVSMPPPLPSLQTTPEKLKYWRCQWLLQLWGEKAVEDSHVLAFEFLSAAGWRIKYKSHSEVEWLQFQDFLKVSRIFKWIKTAQRSVTQGSPLADCYCTDVPIMKAVTFVWICHHISSTIMLSGFNWRFSLFLLV